MFKEFPKIPRLNRDMVITEKIDGTNAAIHVIGNGGDFIVIPQSRNRIISREKDNFGFAQWVFDNRIALAETLGEGIHFGEWWGHGIQRGYGLPKGDRRFSLFNTSRWNEDNTSAVEGLSVVPVLYEGGTFNTEIVNQAVDQLRLTGSKAAPGFMRPEGVIAFHVAGNLMFKVTCEKDEEHKWESK